MALLWASPYIPWQRCRDLARETGGFSYADLKELVLSAMMAWIREEGKRRMDEEDEGSPLPQVISP